MLLVVGGSQEYEGERERRRVGEGTRRQGGCSRRVIAPYYHNAWLSRLMGSAYADRQIIINHIAFITDYRLYDAVTFALRAFRSRSWACAYSIVFIRRTYGISFDERRGLARERERARESAGAQPRARDFPNFACITRDSLV